MPSYWLMKSEPDTFSIDDLQTVKTEPWDGIRNYQARNFLRQMQIDDMAFFYHSNAKKIGIVGVMRISQTAYPDPTQFDPNNDYFDPKSNLQNPRWDLVNVTFVEKWHDVLTLEQLKTLPELDDCPLIKKGNRLSILPLTALQWQTILQYAKQQNLY